MSIKEYIATVVTELADSNVHTANFDIGIKIEEHRKYEVGRAMAVKTYTPIVDNTSANRIKFNLRIE